MSSATAGLAESPTQSGARSQTLREAFIKLLVRGASGFFRTPQTRAAASEKSGGIRWGFQRVT
jgi:hypothetical protein